MSPVATPETLRVLDFPVLIDALAGRCQTPMGRERVVGLTPLDDLDELRRRHRRVDECRTLLGRDGAVGLSPAQPLQAVLERAAVAGTVLASEDLLAAARTARVGQLLRRSLEGLEDLPSLAAIGAAVPDLGPLVKQVATVLDDDGEVRDDASPELAALRRKKRRRRKSLLDGLEKLVRAERLDGVVQDRLVTQRGGRYVVPVRVARRSALEGVVHDSSSRDRPSTWNRSSRWSSRMPLSKRSAPSSRRFRGCLPSSRRTCGPLERRWRPQKRRSESSTSCREGVARFADLTDAVRPVFGDAVAIRGARHPLMIDGVLAADPDRATNRVIELVPLDLEISGEVGVVVINRPQHRR